MQCLNPWAITLFSSQNPADLKPKMGDDVIQHSHILAIWTKLGVPNPESILTKAFHLHPDDATLMRDLCHLLDQEILRHVLTF